MIDIIPANQLKNFMSRVTTIDEQTEQTVRNIVNDIKDRGDKALLDYTRRFDNVALTALRVSNKDIRDAVASLDPLLLEDLKLAASNIRRYHEQQVPRTFEINVGSGSKLGRIAKPIASVGIYVPGGTAAYPSTVLMNAIPARIAGVRKLVMITPPGKNGRVPANILAAAAVAGVDDIYTVGGAQGIAALAYGTETIPAVDKIVGPGNIYVAVAKKLVFGTVGIDMIAGPSEILVITDDTANARFVASDLLSQAEHDELASAILITTSKRLASAVQDEIVKQTKTLSRKDIIASSLKNYGGIVLTDTIEDAIDIANTIAPEHLELVVANPDNYLDLIDNAGAIFIGSYTPESLGDYIAGPNHTLPTNASSRFSSPLSVEDFITYTSVLRFTRDDLATYQQSIRRIAMSEGLDAHARAATIRFDDER